MIRALPKPAEALRLMLDHPDTFKRVTKDLDKYARNLLKKQVKATRTPEAARAVGAALGETYLAIALESLTASDAAMMAVRLDKANPAVREMDPLSQRQHLAGIFSGEIMPKKPKRGAKPQAAPEAPPKPVTEADKILRHSSMSARRKKKG